MAEQPPIFRQAAIKSVGTVGKPLLLLSTGLSSDVKVVVML